MMPTTRRVSKQAKKHQTQAQLYQVGDLVYAKVRGHRPWPAKVTMRTGDGKYHVFFYGTYEAGRGVLPENVWAFMDNHEKFGKNNQSKIYKKALWEITNSPETVEEVVSEEETSSLEMEVEKILSRKNMGGVWQFKILWKAGGTSWRPRSQLGNCKDLMKEFDDKCKAFAAQPNDFMSDPMCRHTGPSDISKLTASARVQNLAPTESQSNPTRSESLSPSGFESMTATRSMVVQLDESKNSSTQPVPGVQQSLVPTETQSNPSRSESMTPTRFETATTSMMVQLDESWNIIPQSVPEDNKPSRDPRNWTYDQVVGELCRMDRRLLYKDLGPLLDKKVAGDVLLSCSLEVLMTVLELDFNTAIRVNEQIAKLKIVVRGLDEIVTK
eukprot:GFUD01032102.1.p1 GENE.GFUD01032102.1~~GFUD01032102.1.p1  ORF type:complete len:384 (+),score=116.24 GFUD01032102.1:74-1225(+)